MARDPSEVQSSGGARCRSYLLRLWQEVPGGRERALLQDVLGGEPKCFSSLESLFAYLDATRGQLAGGEGGGPTKGQAVASRDPWTKGERRSQQASHTAEQDA